MKFYFILVVLSLFSFHSLAFAQRGWEMDSLLDNETSEQWGRLVLKGVQTQFPNKLSLVYSDESQIKTPQQHFPAFYGSFDWHSSVHGHWLLVRLLKGHPQLKLAPTVKSLLNEHLTQENLAKEAAFFNRDEQKAFERMYGWAWFLRLVMELESWQDADAERWRSNLKPLERVLEKRIMAYLPLLSYPIRIGQHTDTAFALAQILDYARVMKRQRLELLVLEKARLFYIDDLDYPVHYEPSGHDFFSSCWNEADLMRRVLPQDEYEPWLSGFVPKLGVQLLDGTIAPVSVSDASDPKIVHLAGLNLHRAWCMQSVASALKVGHPLRKPLLTSSESHLKEGLSYINSGHYEGDHWLATFGLYAVERIGVDDASR